MYVTRWLGLAVLLGVMGTSHVMAPASAQTVGRDVHSALQAEGRVRVIVALKVSIGAGAPLAERRLAIRQAQDRALANVGADDFQVLHRYEVVPALAGIITAPGLAALLANPAVERVDLDVPGSGTLADTVPHINAGVLQIAHCP